MMDLKAARNSEKSRTLRVGIWITGRNTFKGAEDKTRPEVVVLVTHERLSIRPVRITTSDKIVSNAGDD